MSQNLLLLVSILACVEIGSSFLGKAVRKVTLPSPSFSTKLCLRPPSHVGAASTTAPDSLLIPPGILGPPEPLKSLGIGQHVNAFRTLQNDDDDEPDKVQFTIERVSRNPEVFRLRNFVTQSECAQIQSSAEESSMDQAETVTAGDKGSRKNCSVAWLSSSGKYGSSGISSLVSSTANIFISQDVLSHPSAGVEDLQVLRYGTGGEFVHHHDGEPRVLTVIYYINGVGGTWFPLARTNEDELSEEVPVRQPINKAQAMDLIKDLQPGKNGLLVKGTGNVHSNGSTKNVNQEEENEHIAWVNQGDAIAFYNYLDNGSAQLDWRSLHCGLPTTEEEGTKWIANHWYCLNVLEDM